jgi:hypothetical protein
VPKRKVLKSVARSVADSFTSLMNYWQDDYVMGHLLTAARQSGKTTLAVDLLSGISSPDDLLTPPVASSVKRYCDDFRGLVIRSGADPAFVTSATLQVAFDTSISLPLHRDTLYEQSPYVCLVRVVDDRGKIYESTLKGWWFPEKLPPRRAILSRIRRLFRWA